MISFLFTFVIVLSTLSTVSAVTGWTYKPTADTCGATAISPCGPAYWGKVNPRCDGLQQTPVDITNAVPKNTFGLPKFSSKTSGCKV